jgi:hypothetical protein
MLQLHHPFTGEHPALADRPFHLTKASVHPVLKSSSWRVSVLIQIERRIDRRCPYSNRRIMHPVLLFSLLFLCNSSGASTKWTVGSSDGANPIWPSAQCTKYTDGCFYDTVGSSDGGFSSSFLPRF